MLIELTCREAPLVARVWSRQEDSLRWIVCPDGEDEEVEILDGRGDHHCCVVAQEDAVEV